MKSDLVERAAAVVRERYDGESPRALAAEARVLHALDAKRARRRWQLAVMAPLLATLLASGAWAAAGEGVRARLRSVVGRSSVLAPPPARPTSTPEIPRGLLADEAQSAEAAAVSSRTLAPSRGPASVARVPRVAVAAPARPGSALAPRVPPAEPEAADVASKAEPEALFRAAQRAQFTDRDPVRALELWDRYLAAAPNGSLTPEARYNRAIDLARLGRKAEAVQALEPFARGDYGPYRQVEASALVKALSAAP
jgi:hypothetical protein